MDTIRIDLNVFGFFLRLFFALFVFLFPFRWFRGGFLRLVFFRFLLRGTITFEQDGTRVRVTDTTYENAFDRALEGEGTLEGNRLLITLVPRNGETDYSAEVLFLFGDEGATFCVEFDDTNGDAGPMGTYRGERLSR